MTLGRDARLAALGYRAIPGDNAGEFAGKIEWAHPLDALADPRFPDPLTGQAYLEPKAYDAGVLFAERYMRGKIARGTGAKLAEVVIVTGEQSDTTAFYADQWREMARAFGSDADLAIEVCCMAKMPWPAQARRLAAVLNAWAKKNP